MNLNKKCIGCGVYLTNDPTSFGYTPKLDENKKYCMRCFQLKNYNRESLPKDVVNNEVYVNDVISEIDLKNLLILNVLDILDLDNTIIDELSTHQDSVVFIVNKLDLLPKKYHAENTNHFVEQTLMHHGFKHPKIIYSSIKNNSSIKRIFSLIKDYNKEKKKTIFFGKSNVGKSSIINHILKNNKVEMHLTTNAKTNTTLNINKITVDRCQILDCPGIVYKDNILNYVNPKDVEHLIANDIKVSNYQIEKDQSIMVSGLLAVSFKEGTPTTFSFYLNRNVDIKRVKSVNLMKNFEKRNSIFKYNYQKDIEFTTTEITLDESKKHNISLNGLGMISISPGASLIIIHHPKNINIKLNAYAII
ncbi:GTPase [Ureaplasma canigenitalium]|uniref:GTPase n=1 Tax=Ureaplasma canigenitalium TaxID=42092 RepID=UPI0004E16EE8|nr:GTPase [Ureaplasma canigenitalium]